MERADERKQRIKNTHSVAYGTFINDDEGHFVVLDELTRGSRLVVDLQIHALRVELPRRTLDGAEANPAELHRQLDHRPLQFIHRKLQSRGESRTMM